MGFGKGLDSGDPAAVTQGWRGLRNRPGMVWETPPRSPAKPSRPGEPVGGTSHGSVWLCAAADPSGRFAGAGAQPERAVQRRECPSARSQADGAAGSLLATAGAMRAAGLLLAWALLHPAATQQCHPASPGGVLRFTDRHAEIRVPALHRVPSSLDPLYGLVRRCLDLIQQNPLPTGEPRAGEPLLRGPGPRGVGGCNPRARSCSRGPEGLRKRILPLSRCRSRGKVGGASAVTSATIFLCRAAQDSPE